MLSFEQIKEYFNPGLVKLNPKGILVEYLQYEFLDSLFKKAGSEHLSFIGGTAIRIIHDSKRFSEDLDFDNFGLSYNGFKDLMVKICGELRTKGIELEQKCLSKGKVYHCYIKFPNLISRLGISPHQDEKVFLSVDAEQKKKIFIPEVKNINRFGVFRGIQVNPAPVLLAQKLMAILLRKREQGRDFYDASFLGGKVKPDYSYIKKMLDLNQEEFANKLIKRCAKLKFKALAQEVEAFLFDADDTNRILNFKDSLSSILDIR